jgi:hypothetical protein
MNDKEWEWLDYLGGCNWITPLPARIEHSKEENVEAKPSETTSIQEETPQ